MISRFFIDRPIFAAVLSIVITLTGVIAIFALPVAQYPQITPPSVQVAITYPGASSQVVADTVAAPIEQQVNGVENMLYLSSQMGNDGSYTLTVTFDIGTDLNTALVMVQNRVTLALPQLPADVQRQGITIRKKTPDILNVINLISPDGRYDDVYLSNYATINVKDELLRLEGVSDINYLGQRDYSIRIWLDPQRLAALGMTAGDVAVAVQRQNLAAAPGQIGQPPAVSRQLFQLPVNTLGRLATPEEFGEIVVKVGASGPAVALKGTLPQSGSGTSAGTSGQPTTMQVGAVAPTASSPSSALSFPGISIFPPLVSPLDVSANPFTIPSTPATSSSTSTSTQGDTGSTTTSPTPSLAPFSDTTSMQQAGSVPPSTGTSSASTSQANTSTATDILTGTSAQPSPGSQPLPGRPLPLSPGIVRLRDVARIELGAAQYTMACTFDGKPSVALAIHQLPGTNALDVGERVRNKMEDLKTRFPDGVDYRIAYDTTPFVRESVNDVVKTLFEAVAIVAAVVLLFLQNWRAALIPLIAVPVAIFGTFAVMAAVRFSLNNISLFGLVLAIGIVVDDAIVVVENVERWMERGLTPTEATRRAMDEVTGPIIAVALVLCAVFVPPAFLGGITGQFFRQFAVTIAASTTFSTLNSLTLSPALAALLLRPRTARPDPLTWLMNGTLGWFFRAFNWAFALGTAGYARAVGFLMRGSVVVLVSYAGLMVLTLWVFGRAPTGFIPQQDQGRLIVNVELPDAASLQRTQEAMVEVEKICLEDPGVSHTTAIAGLSFLLSADSSNFGSVLVVLKPFDERRSPDLTDQAIMARLRNKWRERVLDASVAAYGAPPIPGLSVAGGFKLMVEDRANLGLPYLESQTDELITNLRKQHGFVGVLTQFRSNTPQYYAEIDRNKVSALGVSLADVDSTLQIYLGSFYANNFNAFGRDWQVNLQADGKFRSRESGINLLQVRNKYGQMIPLGTLVNLREVGGPVMVIRYNLYVAAPITGAFEGDLSTGDAIKTVDAITAETLPRSMGTEWTELMFMQIRAGDTALAVFALAVLGVFLALAALYESWSQPLAVILVVPLCLLCSVTGVLIARDSVNIFVQIGLVVLVGLACKNAILIVEFAKQLRDEGRPRFEATRDASELRLRPILMTSFAFILGVVPLVVAGGAGAEMRRSLGTAVFSGMLGVTLFGIFLTPVFFYVIEWFGETRLLSAFTSQWAGSALLGAVLGAVAGFLLVQVGITPSSWTPWVGACLGIPLALLVPVLQNKRTIFSRRGTDV